MPELSQIWLDGLFKYKARLDVAQCDLVTFDPKALELVLAASSICGYIDSISDLRSKEGEGKDSDA